MNAETTPIHGKVLNVDDDEANRYVTTRILRQAGHEVVEAVTGAQALELATAQQPDAMVLDVLLPDIDGFEVCRLLRQRKETESIPVLHLTAHASTYEERMTGLEAGATAYMVRPVAPRELLATIGSMLLLRQSERRAHELAEQLAEMSRRKDEFIAMLGHELRNPLAAIVTASHVLDPAHQPNDAVRERARKTIQHQSRHLARLVDDLLEVSRILRGRIELRPSRVNLADVSVGAIEAVQHVMRDRQHTFQAKMPTEPLYVKGDAARMEQVLTNLLDNAAKYTPHGGHVWLDLERRDAKAVIRVRDDGAGIARERIREVFEPFVQADQGAARTGGGLGLGLTIVRELVMLHDGNISLASELGRGTEVTVTLPAHDERGADARSPGELTTSGPSPGGGIARAAISKRVLVVDDADDARDMLSLVLATAGHQVQTARTGEDALAIAGAERFDAIVLDLGLPGIDGYEVTKRLRASGTKARIIALSGYGSDEHRARTREAGADEHLVKPAEPNDVLGAIARA